MDGLKYNDNKIVNLSSKIDMFRVLADDGLVTDDGVLWKPMGKLVRIGNNEYMVYSRAVDGFENILPLILSDIIDINKNPELIYDADDRVKYMRVVYYYEEIPIQSIIDDNAVIWYPTASMGLCTDGLYRNIYVTSSGVMNVFPNK